MLFNIHKLFQRKPVANAADDWASAVLEAKTGGALPPVAPPKTKPKQQSYPGFLTTTRTNTGTIIQKIDPQLANIDITQTYRLGRSTNEVMRNLARASPDLAAAISAHIRVGIPEKYFALARDPDGTVNDDATRLVYEIMQRFDKLPVYDAGFSQVASLRSAAEALAKEGLLYGAMAMELVLDSGRLPSTFSPVFVPNVKFYPDEHKGSSGLKPVQDVGGELIDLDIPTFFMTWLDASLSDPYPQGPLEATIQPVLMSSTFLADLRRVMYRHVYPRYDVSLNEEKLRAAMPIEIQNDPDKQSAWMNARIQEASDALNTLTPEEALVHYDFIEISYIKNDDGGGSADKFEALKGIIDANVAKGAKVMPAVLGNGAGSQNVASTETLLFTLTADSMVRLKLQELFSRAFTLAVRLFGHDVTVGFEYFPIEMRPRTELEAFKTMEFERLCKQYALGIIGPMEFCIRTNGFPMPAGFKDESGTVSIQDILTLKPAEAENAYSGTGAGGGQSGGGAATQSTKSKAPAKAKGGQK